MYNTSVVIIGSNVWGPYTLFDIGHSAHVGLLSPTALRPLVEEMNAVETSADCLIHEWQQQGALADHVTFGKPGAIAWKVSCSHSEENQIASFVEAGESWQVTWRIAKWLQGQDPQVVLEYDRASFDANDTASMLASRLATAAPLRYRLKAKYSPQLGRNLVRHCLRK